MAIDGRSYPVGTKPTEAASKRKKGETDHQHVSPLRSSARRVKLKLPVTTVASSMWMYLLCCEPRLCGCGAT